MSASNIILALDIFNAAITTQTKISAAIGKAAAEDRDITDEELKDAAKVSDDLMAQVRAEL